MQFIGDIKTPTVLELCALIILFYIFVYKPLVFLLRWLSNNCCASSRVLIPGDGDFAVITGASDGIGLEYARQLAEKGYSLVLLSRTEEKLKRVGKEIQEQYPQCKKIEILAVDFSRTDIYDRIKLKLESLDGQIHVLVNNVGMMYPTMEYFTKYPDGFQLQMLNANVVALTMMSEIVLRIMEKQNLDSKIVRKSSAKGIVINLSSAAGLTEFPLASSYSASKAYVNYLSKILSTEFAHQKILVQTVNPNIVDTNMAKEVRTSPQVVSARDFVRYALKTVGTEQQTSAHPKHKFLNGLTGPVMGLLGDNWGMKLKLRMGKQMREQKVAPVEDKV